MIEEEQFNGEGSAPKVDEDWKSQVQHERELPQASSGERNDEVDRSPPEMDYSKLPPADFSMLISMFATQAMVALGVIPEPTSGKPRTQLPLARHFIDLLGVLEEKTKGNLTERESESLVENLHPLRMMYLEMSKRR
jgi:hypothetical protein